MSGNVEEEGVASSLGGVSHELLIRRGDNDDEAVAASTQQSVVTTSGGETALNLAQGENWLRLVASLGTNSVLQDTQETAIGTVPFPTISSLSEVGTIDAPTEDCYICIDVDGPYVSIKDMRALLSSQESEDEVFDICIKRRKQRVEKIAELADSQETGIGEEYHALEALERRQLRVLHQGDCIVTRNNAVGPGRDLVLEYHQYKADESRTNGLEMADESQVVDEHAGIATASAGTEASKPSDRPQTQPDPTPKLSDYQTAKESQPTQQSEEENSETSFEGDEGEATQAFARSSTVLSTQSPEKQRDSDDETAMDVDANEKEQTFMTPSGRESELVAQPQERSTGGLAAEIERKMELSTQSISSRENADEENGEQRSGNVMSPIAEESAKIGPENEDAEGTTKSSSANDKLYVPRSQASTTLDDTQRSEGFDEEENVGSDSDALLDDEDIKDASIDVPKTPNKTDSVSEIDATAEKTIVAGNEQPSKEKDELASDERGMGRPERSVGDDTFSDSSSITEIDEETTKPIFKESVCGTGTTNESQDDVAETAGEPAPSASDDDDITEPGDLMSPREGLDTVPTRGNSGTGESPSTKQNEAEEVELGALTATETTDSVTLKQPHKEEETETDKVVEEVDTNESAAKPAVERNTRKVIEWESREDNSLSGSAEVDQGVVEEAVVAETDEGKSSTDSSPPKVCLSHTEETEVTNNMSSSVNRQSPAEKEVTMAEEAGVTVDEVEAKFVETAESSVPPSKETIAVINAETDEKETKKGEENAPSVADEHPSPEEAPVESNASEMEATSNNADDLAKDIKQTVPLDAPVDQKAMDDESSARAESDHAENNKGTDQEEFPGDNEVSSTVDNDKMAEAEPPSRPTRASKKKAAAAKKDGNDKEEEEDAVKLAAKKRSRSTHTKAKHDESLSTPANKRDTRETAGLGLRGSTRKRTRGARTPTSGDEAVRVLMTGVAEGEKEKKMIASIGGVLIEKVEDAHTATHVIAGDDKNSLRRTPKLMIGMCRTSNIVYLDWLIKSAKSQEPLACKDFLLLKDKTAERKYGFKMRESLQRGETLRQNDTFLLSGYWVYVCDGVAGNKAPPEKELELIVGGAGGTWLTSIGTRVMKDLDATKLIIISPEKPNKKKSKSSEKKDVEKAIKLGAQEHPASWLFDSIINQKLDEE